MSKKHFNRSSIEDEFETGSRQHTKGGKGHGSRDIRRQAAPILDAPEQQEDTPAEANETSGFTSDEVSQFLMNQMTAFVKAQDGLDAKTVNERKAIESSLFSMEWPHKIHTSEDGPMTLFMIDRSVRIDRDTHKLNRASCTIVAILESGDLRYTITAYLTNRFTGTVAVIPIGPSGPIYRESKRYNFNMSDQA